MKKILAGILIYAMTMTQVFGQAALLPNAKQTFLGTTGAPLAGGSVTFYVPGTTNKKTTWLDSTQVSNNTNPVVLDAAGRAVIYGQGNYRQLVKDAAGNTIWDAATTAYGSSSPSGATGTDTAPVGAVMQWASFTLPTNWLYANGQAVSRTTYPDLLTAITVQETTASCTSGSGTLGGFTDTSLLRVGAAIEATCLPVNTTVSSIVNSSTVTVNNLATATGVVTATIFPWGDGDGTSTFNLPDLRGRVSAGSDSMAAAAASRLTKSTTISTTNTSATATVASATGLYPGMSVASVNVPYGTTLSALSGTTVTLSANATATASGTAVTFGAFAGASASGSSGGSQSHTLTAAESAVLAFTSAVTDPGHSHNMSYNVANAAAGSGAPALESFNSSHAQVNSSTVTTGITVATTSNAGGNAHSIIQPTITFNYIIKVKSNSSGAGGVVSIGGLFGDIAVDSTIQAYTSGSPSVNYIGLANALTGTVLSNVSGSTAQPAPTTTSALLDYTIGSSRGTFPYRGASTWGALPIGANNTWMKSNGTDAAWTPLPVASASQQGIVQGDGSTLTISGGTASCTTATAGQIGCVKPDNSTLSIAAGTVSCTASTSSQIGCVKPDGTTIVATGGTITAIGAATTSVGVGTTTVAAGINGYLLYDNAGTLGNTPLTSVLDSSIGSAQGTIAYRNATSWVGLPPGINGQSLRTGGSGANISWSTPFTSVTAGNGLTGGTITTSGPLAADIATNANIWGATTNKLLDAGNVFGSAGQIVALSGLTNVVMDLTQGSNFSYTATAGSNYTLANPTLTSAMIGRMGCIYLSQPASLTVTTITFGTNWVTPGGVSGKALTTSNSAIDQVCYLIRTTSSVVFNLANNVTH